MKYIPQIVPTKLVILQALFTPTVLHYFRRHSKPITIANVACRQFLLMAVYNGTLFRITHPRAVSARIPALQMETWNLRAHSVSFSEECGIGMRLDELKSNSAMLNHHEVCHGLKSGKHLNVADSYTWTWAETQRRHR